MQVRGRRLVSGRWSRPLLAMLAGGLPVFAFPAPSLWWVACVALVPWILLIRSAPTGRRAVTDGWWGELGFVLAVHHWLLPSTHVLSLVPAVLLGALWGPWRGGWCGGCWAGRCHRGRRRPWWCFRQSSVGFDLRERPDLARRLTELPRATGAPVLVNVDTRRTDRPGIHTSSVLVDRTARPATGDRHDKMRLVPFGEYIPLRPLLGWATSVGRVAGEDRGRGREQVVMEAGRGLRIGPLICSESAFPDMSRDLARRGADLLLAQSSTSTFQHSWAPARHASPAALRAAETGRPMVHASLRRGVRRVRTGPDGRRVGARLGTDASAARVSEVPAARDDTLYVRLGDWPVHAALVVLGVFGVREGVRAVRRRRSAPAPSSRPARTAHGSPARRGR